MHYIIPIKADNNDMKILKILQRTPRLSLQDIEKKFKDPCGVKDHFITLERSGLVEEFIIPDSSRVRGLHTGTYVLTPRGKEYLKLKTKTWNIVKRYIKCVLFFVGVICTVLSCVFGGLSYIDHDAKYWADFKNVVYEIVSRLTIYAR